MLGRGSIIVRELFDKCGQEKKPDINELIANIPSIERKCYDDLQEAKRLTDLVAKRAALIKVSCDISGYLQKLDSALLNKVDSVRRKIVTASGVPLLAVGVTARVLVKGHTGWGSGRRTDCFNGQPVYSLQAWKYCQKKP
jgi:hypothetical protein